MGKFYDIIYSNDHLYIFNVQMVAKYIFFKCQILQSRIIKKYMNIDLLKVIHKTNKFSSHQGKV